MPAIRTKWGVVIEVPKGYWRIDYQWIDRSMNSMGSIHDIHAYYALHTFCILLGYF